MRAALKPLSLLVGLALAVLCVLSAADRAVERAASPTPPLLTGFGVSGYRQLAERAMEAKAWRLAIAAAARVVAWAPIERNATSLLGTAEAGAGEQDLADASFRVAGQLGWRDPVSQLYWLDQAVALGDYGVATQRADALLRTGASDPGVDRGLRAIEEAPAGRAALAERLAQDPGWKDRYLEGLRQLTRPQAANRTQVVLLAVRKGLADGEPLAVKLSQTWLELHDPATALAVWTRLMGPGQMARTGFWDADFAGVGAAGVNPFRWQTAPSGAYELSVAPAPTPPGGKALLVRTYGTGAEVIAAQYALLGPGRYRLEWYTSGENGQPSDNLEVRTWCDDGAPIEQSGADRAGAHRWRVVTVSTGTCAAPGFRIMDNPPVVGDRPVSLIYGIALHPAEAR